MMTNIRNFAVSLFACAALAFCQSAPTATTLASALAADASQSVVNVASATNILAPSLPFSQGGIGSPSGAALTLIFVDKELMRVNGVNGTQVFVERGYHGTNAQAHANGAKVWVGPASYFTENEPSGVCNLAQLTVNPRVVYTSGNVWNCGNGVWTTFGVYNAKLTVGAVINSATAAVIAPTNPVTHVSGTSALTGITVPPACPATACQIVLIPDGAFTWTAAGNLVSTGTAIVGKAITFTYDAGTAKWYPSY